jgi:hypothetical protein
VFNSDPKQNASSLQARGGSCLPEEEIIVGYQFLHVETYGREGAHKKNCSTRKSSMFEIRDEMIRAPHFCSHIAEPLPPHVLLGMTPEVAFALADERAGHAVDKRGYKLRCDSPVVIVGVASWPELVVDVNNDPEKLEHYRQWRDETLVWAKRQWGDDLKCVVEHLDEDRPHVHFVVVPKLDPDSRLRIASVHPGHRAAEKAAEASGTGRDQKKAHKEAMVRLQDDYYEGVSVKFGLLRFGPRLHRLTRAEWRDKKRQAEALAQAHTRIQRFVANVKAKAEHDVVTRTAEANQAAQAKIDAITTQSHHSTMMLKQKAMQRIAFWKERATLLESALSEKDAMIAEQDAKLETMMGVLRENGLAASYNI